MCLPDLLQVGLFNDQFDHCNEARVELCLDMPSFEQGFVDGLSANVIIVLTAPFLKLESLCQRSS